MKCKFCLENEGIYRIEIFEGQLIRGVIFICKECLNENKFKFNII